MSNPVRECLYCRLHHPELGGCDFNDPRCLSSARQDGDGELDPDDIGTTGSAFRMAQDQGTTMAGGVGTATLSMPSAPGSFYQKHQPSRKKPGRKKQTPSKPSSGPRKTSAQTTREYEAREKEKAQRRSNAAVNEYMQRMGSGYENLPPAAYQQTPVDYTHQASQQPSSNAPSTANENRAQAPLYTYAAAVAQGRAGQQPLANQQASEYTSQPAALHRQHPSHTTTQTLGAGRQPAFSHTGLAAQPPTYTQSPHPYASVPPPPTTYQRSSTPNLPPYQQPGPNNPNQPQPSISRLQRAAQRPNQYLEPQGRSSEPSEMRQDIGSGTQDVYPRHPIPFPPRTRTRDDSQDANESNRSRWRGPDGRRDDGDQSGPSHTNPYGGFGSQRGNLLSRNDRPPRPARADQPRRSNTEIEELVEQATGMDINGGTRNRASSREVRARSSGRSSSENSRISIIDDTTKVKKKDAYGRK